MIDQKRHASGQKRGGGAVRGESLFANLEGRGAMQLGANFAGTAIENSMLGATHACANPLTAHYGITHGVAIGIMLPHVIRFNAPAVGGLYGDLGEQEASEDHGPLVPVSTYGASKLAAEAYLSVYAHTFGIRTTVVRFPNVVGERATHGVLFDFNKSTLKPESDPVLQHVQALMAQSPALKLQVQGHTDNVGTDAYNQKLSDDRAAAVVAWLTQHQVKNDRLTSQGYGKTRPVADNNTDEGRAKNRRVDVVILNQYAVTKPAAKK